MRTLGLLRDTQGAMESLGSGKGCDLSCKNCGWGCRMAVRDGSIEESTEAPAISLSLRSLSP